MLTHTSGLRTCALGKADRVSAELTVARAVKAGLEFEPGSAQAYNPYVAFDVLAQVLEAVSGEDFSTFLQREIFAALDCPKHIGVSLNESLLMTPRKSVTAIVGIGAPCAQKTGCQACTQINCTYRRSI